MAKKLAGSRAIYLVTTHIHPEHDLGAQAFPATTRLIRSTDQVKDIAACGLQLAKVFATRSPLHAELLKDADFRKADITFERDYDLDLGGVQAKIIAMGPNHTVGDTIVWIKSERVLFSGDLAMRPQPVFASPQSSLRHWLANLDRLEALKPGIIVPSHGPTGDGTGLSPAIALSHDGARPDGSRKARRPQRRPGGGGGHASASATAPRTRRASPARSRRLTPRRHERARSCKCTASRRYNTNQLASSVTCRRGG